MKKIYILIFLLVSGFGFGQVNLTGTANYHATITANVTDATGDGCTGGGLGYLHLNGIGNSYILKNDDEFWEGRTDVWERDYTEGNLATSISLRTRRRTRSGGCKITQEKEVTVPVQRSQDMTYTNWDDLNITGVFAYNVSGTLRVQTYPIINLRNPIPANNIVGTESSIFINPISGILNEYFQWMFLIEGETTWRSLPAEYQGKNSLDIKCKDFLPFEAVGKKITLRANVNGTTVTLNYNKSAPHIISVESIKTTCSDTKDGKLKVIFDRPLMDGEQLNYTTLDYITGTPLDYRGPVILTADNSFIISGIEPGNRSRIDLVGYYKGAVTYTLESTHHADFTIVSADPVSFTLQSADIKCRGGQDGTITINVAGGKRDVVAEDYYSIKSGDAGDDNDVWIPFPNNGPYTITNLPLGIYNIKVKDMSGCVAKENGKTKVLEAKIDQPKLPLEVNYTFKKDPIFYGGHNGKIVAAVTGGTINDDKTYNYQWKDSNGTIWPASGQYNTTDKTYNITLDNVPAGEYKLTVTDKNYNTATNKEGCSVIESSEVLVQPDPIVILLAETQSISCNSENVDSETNKFSDGILQATVTGGILPYQYVWSKFNAATNVWDVLEDKTSNIADNLSKGNYSLNVLDKNGITQGTYNTTDLVTAIPTAKEIAEPTKMELSFTSGNVSCNAGNNGWAKANVTGGMLPYTFTWYNVDGGIINENEITQLITGNYTVEITDAKGCFIKGEVQITEPKLAVAINYETINEPTFNGGTNGKIVAEITGGTPNDNGSYNYEWKNAAGNSQITTAEIIDGKYSITLDGVPADDYFLTIKDKNYNETTNQVINCSIIESKVSLNEPDPLTVTFEIVRTISCNTSNEFGNDTDTTPNDGQRDESQDGILIAHVTGGTPLASSANNELPYYFYWKKQQADGSWIAWDNHDETAENLSHGNYALNVKDRNGIMLGTYVNNQLTQEIDATQFMQEPSKLSVTITKGDVFCNGGNDGWATANVVGGTAPYTFEWSNGVEIAENTILTAGNYWVIITDSKGCTTQADVTIVQPNTPVSIKYTEVLNPGFYKATNGKIVVEVTGGTILSDNSYWFEWKNSNGAVQTTATTNFNNGFYTISLTGLPEETYSLTVRDANYDAATNKTSCTVANSITTLEDPDPLKVVFEVQRTISCNVGNEFGNETDANPLDAQRDESQDGILVAHVTGGIQLPADKNNGLPYFYTWKKQQADGSWVAWNDNDETAENISHGTYALNVEDANGIKLGTYVNNVLVKEEDVTQFMPEPAKLVLTFTKMNASCNNGDDGWAEAYVSGGTAPYTYEWTNGENTAKIENLTTNNYFVMVTDAKGCAVQGSIFVGDPKGILTTEIVKNPTCSKGNDGSIILNVTGGNLPYSYIWNTGATTKDLNNLVAGNYEVSITCPDCCVYKKRFVLKDPNPIVVDLGKDRTLCSGQVLDLDATIKDDKAQYSWTSTNGFVSNDAKVSLTKAGIYHVKVTSGLGCVGEDEIVIKTSQAAISSEFLLSSQAYLDEEVILVNTSNPFGESTEWILPKGIKVVEQKEKYITLKFNEIGTYTIGLQQTQGECYATYNKNITVEKRSTLPNASNTSKFIIDFIVTPNPSDGNFKAIVNLENNSAINLRLFATTGQFVAIQKKDSGKKKYEVDFNTTLESGMYILVLETEQQTLVKKIIIH